MELNNKLKNDYKDVLFNASNHTYTVKGKDYIPVSNIVKTFVEPFDAEGNAKRVALREGTTKEEILRRWEHGNKQSLDLGTAAHQFAEDYAYSLHFDSSFSFEHPKNKWEEAAKKYIDELPDYLMPVALELRMYSKGYLYAGTLDLLLYNRNTKRFIIADYKTNKDLFKNFMGKIMLFPFHYLLDMPYNHYQLQLSLYQIILEEAGYEIEDRVIIWLKSDGNYRLFSTKDFRKMLKKHFNENKRSN